MNESGWRRALAQHILTVNRDRVFEGRPPHPLKAVVVLEVGADGRVRSASVLRAPKHARELVPAAVSASPRPGCIATTTVSSYARWRRNS